MRALKAVTDDDLLLDAHTREITNDPSWPNARHEILHRLPYRERSVIENLDGERPSPTATVAIRKLRTWFDEANNNTIAVLAGTVGSGKTAAACWLALYRMVFMEPQFITAHDLSRLRTGDKRDEIYNAEALIIDDLGDEHPLSRDAWLADVDELVNGFYASESWAVITTNLTWPQFAKRYGPRVADRITGGGVWITGLGPSMRGANHEHRGG